MTLYLYLAMMLGSDPGDWYPTTNEICEDLGLSSPAVVFAALRVLVDEGFIRRERRHRSGRRGRHNVYRLPSCEFTVYRLLQRKRIDAMLRARRDVESRMSPDSRDHKSVWLRRVLGDAFDAYHQAPMPEKRSMLLAALERLLIETGEIGERSE